jgi:hypothetical protein
MREITIDEQFKYLLPVLDEQTFALLEESLLANGCMHPLVLWGDILIDGHNRYEICQKHEIPFETVEMEFASRDEAMIWIITTQVGRRNLSPIQLSYFRGLHYNSLGDAQDNVRVRGFLGLYCNDSGRLLAKACSGVVASELNRAERDVRYQALAMLRSHRFPATLCEMAFITNPDEYEVAASAEGVRRSADALANGVLKWIDDQQKWVK